MAPTLVLFGGATSCKDHFKEPAAFFREKGFDVEVLAPCERLMPLLHRYLCAPFFCSCAAQVSRCRLRALENHRPNGPLTRPSLAKSRGSRPAQSARRRVARRPTFFHYLFVLLARSNGAGARQRRRGGGLPTLITTGATLAWLLDSSSDWPAWRPWSSWGSQTEQSLRSL